MANNDLISRAAAMHLFMDKPPEYYHTSYIVGELNCLPSVDMGPVRHGRNLMGKMQSYAFRCSECHQVAIDVWAYEGIKYCPFCGVKIDGGGNAD